MVMNIVVEIFLVTCITVNHVVFLRLFGFLSITKMNHVNNPVFIHRRYGYLILSAQKALRYSFSSSSHFVLLNLKMVLLS